MHLGSYAQAHGTVDQDPASASAASLDWSNLLLRSVLMDAGSGLSGVDLYNAMVPGPGPNPNLNLNPNPNPNPNPNQFHYNSLLQSHHSFLSSDSISGGLVDVCSKPANYNGAAPSIQLQQFIQPSSNCVAKPILCSAGGSQMYMGMYTQPWQQQQQQQNHNSSSSSDGSSHSLTTATTYNLQQADEEDEYDDIRRLMMQQQAQMARQQLLNQYQQQQHLQMLQFQQQNQQIAKTKGFATEGAGAEISPNSRYRSSTAIPSVDAMGLQEEEEEEDEDGDDYSRVSLLRYDMPAEPVVIDSCPPVVVVASSTSTSMDMASTVTMATTVPAAAPTSNYIHYSPISSNSSNSTSCCSTTTDTSNISAAMVKNHQSTTSPSQNSGRRTGSGSGSRSAEAGTPWMDPRLWGRMPEKLLERVLACLPLPAFFRSRLVCKTWYNLMFSDSFLEMCASLNARRSISISSSSSSSASSASASSSRPWFLLFRKGVWSEAFMFDPAGRAWFKLDLSFIPPSFSVVASAGGLLCCISEARGCKNLLICNPLTRSCMQLPCSLKERFVPTVGLVVDHNHHHHHNLAPDSAGSSKAPSGRARYRVMVAGDDLISPFAVKNLTTEVYDSGRQQWRMAAPLPRLCNLESGKTTYANGFFYCMNYSPFSVLSYDASSSTRGGGGGGGGGEWTKIEAPMRRFLRTPNLVECRGRLVLVAAVEKNKLNVPKSIRIWGLQQSRTSWIELERMPQALYDDFMIVSRKKAFHCIGHGNLILITLPDSPDMIIYDFYEKVWRWAPRCPFACSSSANEISCNSATSTGGMSPPSPPVSYGTASVAESAGGFHAFAFDPRLEASVC